MTNPDELKPCPFCGSTRAWPIPANRNSQDRIYPIVRCGGCFTDVPGKNDDYSLDAKTATTAWNRRAEAKAEPVATEAMTDERGVYIASKAKYGPEWIAMRDAGYPVISTWINESGTGETVDWPGLWVRCVNEASSVSALVVIRRHGDVLKGALVEVGAALAKGVPVFAAGIDDMSIIQHPLVTVCASEHEAFSLALEAIRLTRANPPKLTEAQVEEIVTQTLTDRSWIIDGVPATIRRALRLAGVAE